mmetsp:Transcript_35446/g.35109  ORF Transcript_35446/g.35109 Transcript_35446/m.35109 type:complete len:160 (+) Transcript_35446:220-699(+)
MMGQLIKNKILNTYSTLIMSLSDGLAKDINTMQTKAGSGRSITRSQWAGATRLSHQLRTHFQNMSTVLSATHGGTDNKVEAFNLVQEIRDLSNQVALALTEHEFDVDLSCEAGIPDRVFGNLPRFKQIMSILFTVGQKQATAASPMACHLRFLRQGERK